MTRAWYFGRVVRWIVRAVVGVVAAFLALALLYRVVDPPLTLLMLRNAPAYGLQRDSVALGEISPALVRAVIAAEDARFFEHGGVDWEAIRRAREYNARHGDEPLRGGSTITMQCARNVFLWQGRTYVRKGLEIWFAGLMELFWSKPRILEVYLNVIEWGPGIYGVQAASERYFDVPASRLDARQAALLAAVLPNPLRRNPAAPSPSVARRATMIARRADRIRLGPLRARDPGARRTVSAPRAQATARRDPEGARRPAVSQ